MELAIFFSCTSQGHNALSRPGLESGLSNSEPSALTTGLLDILLLSRFVCNCPKFNFLAVLCTQPTGLSPASWLFTMFVSICLYWHWKPCLGERSINVIIITVINIIKLNQSMHIYYLLDVMIMMLMIIIMIKMTTTMATSV